MNAKKLLIALLLALSAFLIGCAGGAVEVDKSSGNENTGEYQTSDVKAGAVVVDPKAYRNNNEKP